MFDSLPSISEKIFKNVYEDNIFCRNAGLVMPIDDICKKDWTVVESMTKNRR